MRCVDHKSSHSAAAHPDSIDTSACLVERNRFRNVMQISGPYSASLSTWLVTFEKHRQPLGSLATALRCREQERGQRAQSASGRRAYLTGLQAQGVASARSVLYWLYVCLRPGCYTRAPPPGFHSFASRQPSPAPSVSPASIPFRAAVRHRLPFAGDVGVFEERVHAEHAVVPE